MGVIFKSLKFRRDVWTADLSLSVISICMETKALGKYREEKEKIHGEGLEEKQHSRDYLRRRSLHGRVGEPKEEKEEMVGVYCHSVRGKRVF